MKDLELKNFSKIGETKEETKGETKGDDKPKIVKASLNWYDNDLEFYKDFVYYQKGVSGNFGYGHKEAMEEIVEILKKKFPKVKPRPQTERDRENNLGRKKKGA